MITKTMRAVPFLLMLASCATSNWTEGEVKGHMDEVNTTIDQFRQTDPTLQRFFDQSYGYAVFPSVATGGLVFGGSHGHGVAFAQGQPVGTAEVTRVSVGAQVGGQTFSEIVFFKNRDDFQEFRNGDYQVSGSVSAVGLDRGAGANAAFQDGVAVFVNDRSGLMAAADIGAQELSFTPMAAAPQ